MIEKRWTLIEPPLTPSCAGAIIVSGAGTASVNGTYCPDVIPLVWTKVGGTIYEDSIYSDSAYGGFWVITSGGLASDDVSNIKYMDLSASGPQSPGSAWTGWAGSPTDITGLGDIIGGAAPAPSVMMGGAQAPDFDAPLSQWTSYRSVNPANLVKFTEEPDLSIGLIARRRKLGSDIVFTGEDYAFFLHYQRRRSLRCEEFYIRREWKCAGVWREVWTGVFSVGSGEWDHDLCQFSVRPEPYDRYTCLLAGSSEKVNLMAVEPVSVSAVIVQVDVEFLPCLRILGFVVCSEPGDPDTEWVLGHDQAGIAMDCPSPTTYDLAMFWRERMTTECIGGNPASPPGAGWVLLENNCATNGTATFIREPTTAWPYGDVEIVVTTTQDTPPPPNDDCDWLYAGYINFDDEATWFPDCNTPTYHHYWVCPTAAAPVTFERARPLQDCMWRLVENTGCSSIENVVSDFFEWNPPGDTAGYVAGQNYVTGETNQVDHLVILQKSDAIDPGASNPATIGEITLKEMLQFLAEVFRVYWIIDDSGNLRLEHISAWRSQSGIDLGAYPDTSVIEPRAYAATSDEAPRVERLKWAEAQSRDFVGKDIVYSGPCVSGENEKSWSAAPFTSDITHINADPDAISKEGFAILACRMLDDLSLEVIVSDGAITGNLSTNAPLSTANLQAAFWLHDRYLWTGRMNDVERTFLNVAPNVQQRPVQLRACCDLLGLQPGAVAMTALGAGFFGGALAVITRLELNEEDDWATFTLRYSV